MHQYLQCNQLWCISFRFYGGLYETGTCDLQTLWNIEHDLQKHQAVWLQVNQIQKWNYDALMVQSLWIHSKCIAPYTLVTHRTNAFIADLYYSFSTLVKFILKLATYSFNALNTWGTDGRNRLSSYVSFGRAILTQQPPFTQLKREMSLHQWSLTKS